MKIGVFGGSFDPIHNGHVSLARYALEHTDLDRLWLMVSPRNPLKEHGPVATDDQRLEMAHLAVDSIPAIEVSDFEFHLPIPSYTYKTLSELKKTYPEHQFRLLIGGDNWENFHLWRNPEEIISQFGVIVYPRPGETISSPPFFSSSQITLLSDAPQMPVSSTQIRTLLSKKNSTDDFVNSSSDPSLECSLHPSVLEYIRTHSLYTQRAQ